MKYLDKSKDELAKLLEEAMKVYKEYQRQKLSLDMTRGKPCSEQLDLSLPMMDALNSESSYKLSNGIDARNYGGLEGIPELRKMFGEIFDVPAARVIIKDESSLNIMYDTVQFCLQFGTGGYEPWNKQGPVKFICPAPGYDRHFAVTQALGVEMITVPMKEDGPDMDLVEMLVAADESIKGIWCVPKYSNPTGTVYSDKVVDRLAAMKTAAPDFRIFWDNAYFTHFIGESDVPLKNIFPECEKAGNPDRVFMFASTSKITFAGAGISMIISSDKNIEEFKNRIKYQYITPNKVVQLMHYNFLQSKENLNALMKKHAQIMRPKFEMVLNTLEKEFGNSDVLKWTSPKGGYFISVDTLEGCAKRVVQLAKDAGVALTNAGATFPYGNDDKDRNIRLAPSYPPIMELDLAVNVFCVAVKIASIEKLLEKAE